MIVRSFLALLMILTVLLTSSASSPSAGSRHVLIVGDSEACRVAPSAAVLYRDDVIETACKVSTRVEYWSEQGHLAGYLARHPRPDAVIVFLGTNHYYDSVAPDVKPILDAVSSVGAACIWVGNTAVHGRRWPINRLLRDAVAPQCTYFDTEAAGIPLADGIHPTAEGARRWLRLVWPLIPEKRP